jgi:hypothetical protein
VPDSSPDLGKKLSTHGISPVYLQRGAFIAVLSFAFFLAMMFGFYIRQSMGYFLLATAFLIIYLLTLVSWFMQRKNLITIHENGLKFRNREKLWSDITKVEDSGRIEVTDGLPFEIPTTVHDFERVIRMIRFKSGSAS